MLQESFPKIIKIATCSKVILEILKNMYMEEMKFTWEPIPQR